MKVHPAAALFPMLDEWKLRELADDIRNRGQRVPIIVYGGQILDGRNRLEACKLAGIEPLIQKVDGSDINSDPVGYVVSVNLRRRHLTPSQLAMVGDGLKEMYAQQAHARMMAGKSDPVATFPHGRARDQAAAQLGISGRTIQKVSTVREGGCEELSEAVAAGRITVNVASASLEPFQIRLSRPLSSRRRWPRTTQVRLSERASAVVRPSMSPKSRRTSSPG